MFLTRTKLASSVLLLARLAAAAKELPSAEAIFPTHGGFNVNHIASELFPDAIGTVSPFFDIDVLFTGYNSSMKTWLTGLDPSSGTDEVKAQTLMSIAYAKPFTADDRDMVADVQKILSVVNGTDTAAMLAKRQQREFIVSLSHVVVWHTCSAFFKCVSGTTCQFSITPGNSPRDQCQSIGGQNCCISWSTYSVQAGFFSTTWINCNEEVSAANDASASCKGTSSSSGGSVCLSNRATNC